MKRTPFPPRRTPLRPSPAAVRAWKDASRGELPKRNPERMKRREAADEVYGSHHKWIRRQPCHLRGPECGYYEDRPNVEGHHLKHTGNGGKDRDNEVPLCPAHHDEHHRLGSISRACEHYRRDWRSIAVEYTAQHDREMAA